MLPELCRRWCDVVGLYVEMAVRDRGREPDAELLRAAEIEVRDLSKATRLERTLIGTFAERLDLTIDEELAAWTLVAAQLVPTVASRVEALSGTRDLTCGAIGEVAFARAGALAVRALSRTGSLVRHGLVEVGDEMIAWAKRPLVVSDRLMSLALLDPLAEPQGGRFFAARVVAPALEELAIHDETLAELREAIGVDDTAIVAAIGLPNTGRSTVLTAIAREHGVDVVTIDAKRMAREQPAFARELRIVARECALLGRTPLFVNLEALADDRLSAFSQAVSDGFAGRVLLTSTKAIGGSDWSRPVSSIEMRATNRHQRAKLWLSSLQQGSESDGVHLASQYPLASGLIVRAAESTRARAKHRAIEPKDIAAGVRSVLDDRIGQFAKRLPVTQTWKDLVLSQDHVDTITELLARVRERSRVYEDWGFGSKLGKGLGVAALFSGPPGTGKTMVASLIAQDLGLELYQVDLSKIVSKWIGESEKNLAALFDAAEAGHAVLLFDEADSMFGKRTDVKSSNDRYANLETNFLLQRLESFSGICLLTSNHESNIDPAFLRRLALHLRFEMPDVNEREHLWQVLLPADAPRAKGIDFARLAREYELTGGYIRNAALRAAFLAVDEQQEITEEHLRKAARLECESMGRIAA